ncbi:MAG: hypothetical protein ACWGQW_12425 [bacterium]
MSFLTLMTMIIVLGILWGGFLTGLALAVTKEKKKSPQKGEAWKE